MRQGLTRPQDLRAPSGQVTLPAHRPPHHDVATGQFVKEDVLVEGSGEEEEAPFAQPRVSETTAGPEIRMLAQQPAGSLHRVEVTIGYLPPRLGQVPVELAFNIRNEIVRPPDAHALEAGLRFRARCRIPSKSALVSRMAG